jgi:hypothetical protein
MPFEKDYRRIDESDHHIEHPKDKNSNSGNKLQKCREDFYRHFPKNQEINELLLGKSNNISDEEIDIYIKNNWKKIYKRYMQEINGNKVSPDAFRTQYEDNIRTYADSYFWRDRNDNLRARVRGGMNPHAPGGDGSQAGSRYWDGKRWLSWDDNGKRWLSWDDNKWSDASGAAQAGPSDTTQGGASHGREDTMEVDEEEDTIAPLQRSSYNPFRSQARYPQHSSTTGLDLPPAGFPSEQEMETLGLQRGYIPSSSNPFLSPAQGPQHSSTTGSDYLPPEEIADIPRPSTSIRGSRSKRAYDRGSQRNTTGYLEPSFNSSLQMQARDTRRPSTAIEHRAQPASDQTLTSTGAIHLQAMNMVAVLTGEAHFDGYKIWQEVYRIASSKDTQLKKAQNLENIARRKSVSVWNSAWYSAGDPYTYQKATWLRDNAKVNLTEAWNLAGNRDNLREALIQHTLPAMRGAHGFSARSKAEEKVDKLLDKYDKLVAQQDRERSAHNQRVNPVTDASEDLMDLDDPTTLQTEHHSEEEDSELEDSEEEDSESEDGESDHNDAIRGMITTSRSRYRKSEDLRRFLLEKNTTLQGALKNEETGKLFTGLTNSLLAEEIGNTPKFSSTYMWRLIQEHAKKSPSTLYVIHFSSGEWDLEEGTPPNTTPTKTTKDARDVKRSEASRRRREGEATEADSNTLASQDARDVKKSEARKRRRKGKATEADLRLLASEDAAGERRRIRRSEASRRRREGKATEADLRLLASQDAADERKSIRRSEARKKRWRGEATETDLNILASQDAADERRSRRRSEARRERKE